MTSGRTLFLVEKQDLVKILADSAEIFPAVQKNTASLEIVFFDTFDFRLFQAGLTMQWDGRQYAVVSDDSREILGAGKLRTRLMPGDSIGSAVHEKLARILGNRAVLQLFTQHEDIHFYSFLNAQQKVVARMHWSKVRATDSHGKMWHATYLETKMLRGYDKAFSKLQTILGHYPVLTLESSCGIFPKVLEGLEIPYRKQMEKFLVQLDADVTPQMAINSIGETLLETLRIHLPGIVDDIDTEFLHDFRVAARRIRSLLSLLKKYVPKTECQHFRSEFKWLFAVTGAVRDLDVHLLEQQEYLTRLPKRLQAGLKIAFSGIKAKRRRELVTMRESLGSERCRLLLDDWQKFVTRPCCDQSGAVKNKKCNEVARKLIRKTHDDLVRKGSMITLQSPPESLHEVRITAKKLRYLMEFFRCFFPEELARDYIDHLKTVQSNLGDYNDLAIQQQAISSLLDSVSVQRTDCLAIASSLGGMLALMADRQAALRQRFDRIFSAFSGAETSILLAEMLNDTEEEHLAEGKSEHEDSGGIQ